MRQQACRWSVPTLSRTSTPHRVPSLISASNPRTISLHLILVSLYSPLYSHLPLAVRGRFIEYYFIFVSPLFTSHLNQFFFFFQEPAPPPIHPFSPPRPFSD